MRGRVREERGAYAILFAIITVAMFTMVAIVVDLGADRTTVRVNRNNADLAALAGVLYLPNGRAACQASWKYLILNGAVPSGTSDPCSSLPTTCDSSTLPVTTTPKKIASTTFTFTYPYSDALLASLSTSNLGTGTRLNDQTQCDRLGIDIRTAVPTLFGGIVGSGRLSAPATAVVVKAPGNIKTPVALLLLEPHGCQVLNANGSGAQILVHASPKSVSLGIPPTGGRITVDSNGKPVSGDNSCNGASNKIMTVSSSSTANVIEAFNTQDVDASYSPVGAGVIEVYAIQPPDLSCTPANNACLQSQIVPPGGTNAFGIINAQLATGAYGDPQSEFQRITRAPFDNTFNCQATYPNYLGLSDVPVQLDPTTCTPGTRPPYINNLVTEIDGGSTAPTGKPVASPASWTQIGTGGTNGPCKVTSGTVSYSGNIYVDCSTFAVSGGTVNFNNGNVVFQGSVQLTGGTININTAPTLPATAGWSSCLNKVLGCTKEWSPNAAFAYFRPGGDKVATCGGSKWTTFCVAAGTTLHVNNSMFYFRDETVFPYNTSGVNDGTCGEYPSPETSDKCQTDDGQFNIKAGVSNYIHVAPTEGPFKNLDMWNESTLPQTIGAQGTLDLTGVFFFPNSSVTYSGQGCSTPKNSQFVARTLNVSGSNACLNMRPTPDRAVNIPIFGPLLIR